jgi:uncharacterized OsmC-like protein/pimeloyl-ACP methyl ester carboxylesterase
MKVENIRFTNSTGDQLAARLYLPLEEVPRFYALFAHCFTCSENFKAVSNISDTLSQLGVAVLSFDFTGLGESEGELSDSGISSSVADLIMASRFLEENYEAPKLMIGHSLGGVAVILAAAKLDRIEAVVTIGTPATPARIKNLLTEDLAEFEERSAAVSIGGRPFRLSQGFVTDLESHDLLKSLNGMRKAFLFMHSPQDRVVELANAADLYQAAFHPKSFVTLDGADHLLSEERESRYVGEVISTWSGKYLPTEVSENDVEGHQVKVRLVGDSYTTEVLTPFHHLLADEPKSVGGHNLGPTPYDLLLASLGACTAMTLKMYANRKGWKLDEINVFLNHEKIHQKDSESVDGAGESKLSRFTRDIEIKGKVTEEKKAKLLEIAEKCPVHKTLHEPIEVETRFKEPKQEL